MPPTGLKYMPAPRVRRLLFPLTVFALGVGLTAVWFQGKPSGMDKGSQAEGGNPTNPAPWKSKSTTGETQNAKEPTPQAPAGNAEKTKNLAFDRARYQARMEANTVASHLRLDPKQTEDYVAARIEDLETPPKSSVSEWLVMEPSADRWLNANLTMEQKQAYETYQKSLVQEKAERAGFSIADGIANSVKLTEQQRAAVARKFAEIFQSDDPYKYPEYLKFAQGDDVDMVKSDPALLESLTRDSTESPLQTKDRSSWLSEILTPDQLAKYRASQEK